MHLALRSTDTPVRKHQNLNNSRFTLKSKTLAMPTDKSITLYLISYDLHPIPEYIVPSTPRSDKSSRNTSSPQNPQSSPQSRNGRSRSYQYIQTNNSDTETDGKTTAYIAKYTDSLFWIRYRVNVKPDELAAYYFFKLSIDGELFTSWGVGAKERWRGKVMFALNELAPASDLTSRAGERGAGQSRGRRWEKIALNFGKGDETSILEIQIFRAYARKKIAAPPVSGILFEDLVDETSRKCVE
jgi:hypothetical protein